VAERRDFKQKWNFADFSRTALARRGMLRPPNGETPSEDQFVENSFLTSIILNAKREPTSA
jgi:hypothetical protein